MKTLKNNISFKLYQKGEQFLEENASLLSKDLETTIETQFFFTNAQAYEKFNQKNYAFRFEDEKEVLLLLKIEPYNALIYGSNKLCKFASEVVANYNLIVDHILGRKDLVKSFLSFYQERLLGEVKTEHIMQIMVKYNPSTNQNSLVRRCDYKDIPNLAPLYVLFCQEALNECIDYKMAQEKLENIIDNFYIYEENGEIKSMAAKARAFDTICAISHVFTPSSYRDQGYAKAVVEKLSQDIIEEKKTPFLYVDSKNKIANHLYSSIGFVHLDFHIEQCVYQTTTIKKIILAGGCFWCMAEPYYHCEGVKKVISGFVGGTTCNPTYDEVKVGYTHHKEAILIEYDSKIITYSKLLDIYFSSINPFDGGGQYIDRGENYTCGIYTSNPLERIEAKNRIQVLEEEYKETVFVAIEEDCVFYKAEEEHQDFALKNPNKMEEEIKKSGRKTKI
ncbi:MAG: peptide-methionine (S)-S-oxide reductase MsrA [Roseburia sp.]|nr:peptide-methionine (S)-S-oxide reductase MsrA [Anaeroplasma bactoclasticum]MCM1196102.1 peptide-methionine (S)-S-oxide reductase MsrA [Roseburia sp.]MCM1557342.1 peptide-methionine (S)-S-oxide reductase MsrA [Anaeroplasma bactoclasticum]